jgi:hypothetical protein
VFTADGSRRLGSPLGAVHFRPGLANSSELPYLLSGQHACYTDTPAPHVPACICSSRRRPWCRVDPLLGEHHRFQACYPALGKDRGQRMHVTHDTATTRQIQSCSLRTNVTAFESMHLDPAVRTWGDSCVKYPGTFINMRMYTRSGSTAAGFRKPIPTPAGPVEIGLATDAADAHQTQQLKGMSACFLFFLSLQQGQHQHGTERA